MLHPVRLALIAILAPATLLAGTGAGPLTEVICDDSARIAQQLTHRFGATKQGRGMRGPDAVLEVWIAPSSGDWTLVQSYANGTSCIVAMGEDWEVLGGSADPV